MAAGPLHEGFAGGGAGAISDQDLFHEGGEFVPDFGKVCINAVVLAEHCDTHAAFYAFCQTFLRGYKKALCDYPKLKESKAMATVERWKAGLFKGEKDA